MDIARKKKIITLKINYLLGRRDEKIDAINKKQQALNAQREAVYTSFQNQLNELYEELATLDGRSSENLRP